MNISVEETVTCLRQLLGSIPGMIVRFVVDQVVPGQIFVWVLWFSHVSIVPSMLHIHSFIYTLLLPEGQEVEACEPSFGIRRALDREVLPHFFSCHSSCSTSTQYMQRAAHYAKFVAPSCADVTTGHAACRCYWGWLCNVAKINHFAASDCHSLCWLCSALVLLDLTISASIPQQGQEFFSLLQNVQTAPGAREGSSFLRIRWSRTSN
jgi:hypothetical protein